VNLPAATQSPPGSSDLPFLPFNWYYSDQFKMESWLCPALLKYFPTAPREIYVKIEPKS